MPELPEVAHAASLLRRAVTGRQIARLCVLHPALRRRLGDAAARSLAGARIERVEQRGKHQLLVLDGGRLLHAHFRMAGDWAIGRVGDPEPRHARALLELTDGTRVALVDPRALATLALLPADASPLGALGPEPLDDAFGAGPLAAALARRRGAIKPVLLDQRVVAGIGNIYAAEALWEARIDPRTPAARLGRVRLERLVDAIRTVIRRAQRAPGRYRNGAEQGLLVYDREGEPCLRCGAPIRRIVQAGRSTYFCAKCQR